jgi:hypothetical protein
MVGLQGGAAYPGIVLRTGLAFDCQTAMPWFAMSKRPPHFRKLSLNLR